MLMGIFGIGSTSIQTIAFYGNHEEGKPLRRLHEIITTKLYAKHISIQQVAIQHNINEEFN